MRRWCSDSWLSSMERDSSVKIGMTPDSSGIPKSCMGTVARSEIIMVSTSSLGSSSPIWRLPISRRPVMMRKYKMTVRAKAVIINGSLRLSSICLSHVFHSCALRILPFCGFYHILRQPNRRGERRIMGFQTHQKRHVPVR